MCPRRWVWVDATAVMGACLGPLARAPAAASIQLAPAALRPHAGAAPPRLNPPPPPPPYPPPHTPPHPHTHAPATPPCRRACTPCGLAPTPAACWWAPPTTICASLRRRSEACAPREPSLPGVLGPAARRALPEPGEPLPRGEAPLQAPQQQQRSPPPRPSPRPRCTLQRHSGASCAPRPPCPASSVWPPHESRRPSQHHYCSFCPCRLPVPPCFPPVDLLPSPSSAPPTATIPPTLPPGCRACIFRSSTGATGEAGRQGGLSGSCWEQPAGRRLSGLDQHGNVLVGCRGTTGRE